MLHAATTLATGRADTLSAPRVKCDHADCEIRGAVIAPLVVDDQVIGSLAAYAPIAGPSLARTTAELARWVSSSSSSPNSIGPASAWRTPR